jgi:hypothetical protein
VVRIAWRPASAPADSGSSVRPFGGEDEYAGGGFVRDAG